MMYLSPRDFIYPSYWVSYLCWESHGPGCLRHCCCRAHACWNRESLYFAFAALDWYNFHNFIVLSMLPSISAYNNWYASLFPHFAGASVSGICPPLSLWIVLLSSHGGCPAYFWIIFELDLRYFDFPHCLQIRPRGAEAHAWKYFSHPREPNWLRNMDHTPSPSSRRRPVCLWKW